MKMNRLHLINEAEARRLLTLFDEGATTIAEEEELYTYFRESRRLPADLQPLRPLMAWYEGGCVGEPEKRVEPQRRPILIRFRASLMAAASVAVLIALGFTAYNHYKEVSEEAELYAGSFVMRNGKIYTDYREIRDELEHARQLSDSIEALVESRVNADAIMIQAVERSLASSSPTTIETAKTFVNPNQQ